MSEILSITLSFFIFFLFLCAPLNINKSKIFKFGSTYQVGIANLIINLNFLIIISLLPIPPIPTKWMISVFANSIFIYNF